MMVVKLNNLMDTRKNNPVSKHYDVDVSSFISAATFAGENLSPRVKFGAKKNKKNRIMA